MATFLSQLSLLQVAALGGASLATYLATLVLYRLYFHPLRHIPGPRLAAVTEWYEIYYDLFVGPGGQYIYHLGSLHDKYGPVIRISPEEVHVRDSEWFDKLYANAPQIRDRWPKSIRSNDSPGSVASSCSHEMHRARKAVLLPFFSKAKITTMEDDLRRTIELLCTKLTECAEAGKTVSLGTAFVATTYDVITQYCYGKCQNALTEPDFAPRWEALMTGLLEATCLARHFPIVVKILKRIPQPVTALVNPAMLLLVEAQELLRGQAVAILQSEAQRTKPIALLDDASGTTTANTIFHGILRADIPAEEKTLPRMIDEGFVLVLAGGETTARIMTTVCVKLAEDPALLRRVRAELDTLPLGPGQLPDSNALEQLPFFRALIQEGLRYTAPVLNRSIQMAREDLECHGLIIPRNTPISMTFNDVLFDPSLFPNPHTFDPARWGRAAAAGARLDRYMVAFGKGSRSCLGLHLATAEMYLGLAAVLARFDLRMAEDFEWERDMRPVRDCFVGMPVKGSRGARVRLAVRK